MIIGVDSGCLGVRDERLKVGVYHVAVNLLQELGKIDKKNTYYLYSFYPIEEELLKSFGPKMKNIVIPATGWLFLWLPVWLIKNDIDVFLALSQVIPHSWKRIKMIGLIHDIAFEKYPQFYPDSYKHLHAITRNLVKKSNRIITVSQNSKNDICEYYSISPHSVSSIPLGVRNSRYSSATKYDSKKYFLSVGALKRIKNVPMIIRAFESFCRLSSSEEKLLIVGGDKWKDPAIDEALSSLPKSIQKRIVFLGYVPDSDLPTLYIHATALLTPSYYEGFGLPVVEAMQAGCPVIVSDRGSLPEVVGDAGIIVEPDDSTRIAQEMKKIAEKKTFRDAMSQKGRKRAKYFTWRKCAVETLAVIDEVTYET
jgi:glycosyltransferase involved in cell wall biosynthesis